MYNVKGNFPEKVPLLNFIKREACGGVWYILNNFINNQLI
jgi:hypothetical protein